MTDFRSIVHEKPLGKSTLLIGAEEEDQADEEVEEGKDE
jgi:hypothetical protein